MSNSPGRPKGTRVVKCKCGRRVVGAPGTRVPCPGCKKNVTIPSAKKERARDR